jgi:hypothetical protein
MKQGASEWIARQGGEFTALNVLLNEQRVQGARLSGYWKWNG